MNVVVVKDDSETVTPKNLRDIDITYKDSSGNEKTVKLSSVSDISKSETMDKISRENQSVILKSAPKSRTATLLHLFQTM